MGLVVLNNGCVVAHTLLLYCAPASLLPFTHYTPPFPPHTQRTRRTLSMAPGHKTALLALARAELAEADPKDYPKTLDRVVRCAAVFFWLVCLDAGRGGSMALGTGCPSTDHPLKPA
jgi:hypothetical protein